jgi:hypothetical protein
MENATQLEPLADSGEISSFNYLVGERRTVAGTLRPCAFAVLRFVRFCRLEIDDDLELGGPQDWKVCWLV